METFLTILKLLPMVLELIKLIQLHRLTAQQTEDMVNDLTMTAEYLATRAIKAKTEVKHTDEDIINDPYNRD